MDSYEDIPRPYDDQLSRQGSLQIILGDINSSEGAGSLKPTGIGPIADTPVKSTQSMADLWIDREIRSVNWKPQTTGFRINGRTGSAEFADAFISGDMVGGTIALGSNAWHVDSSGNMWWGNYTTFAAAQSANAPTISAAGVVYFASGTFSGTITSTSFTGITITSSTITGGTIQTASSGLRIRLSSSPTNKIEFLNGSTLEGSLAINSFNDGFGEYFLAELTFSGGVISTGTILGVAESSFFEAVGVSATQRAAVGNAFLENGITGEYFGIFWTGGGAAYLKTNVIPTSSAGLPAGSIWSNAGVLTLV